MLHLDIRSSISPETYRWDTGLVVVAELLPVISTGTTAQPWPRIMITSVYEYLRTRLQAQSANDDGDGVGCKPFIMKFFITSVTVLVLYVASSVVAAPLPAPAIAAYDGNMMKRGLYGVVDLERSNDRGVGPNQDLSGQGPSQGSLQPQDLSSQATDSVTTNSAVSEPNAASAPSSTDQSPVSQ
ncbi:hypothetical protein FRB91_005274 [Serendipita sp. 411]|nr:hypothetical protein FRB91_005274 [Serendipita sp. 411]